LVVDGIFLIWNAHLNKPWSAIKPGSDDPSNIGCYVSDEYRGWKIVTIYLPLWSCWVFTLFTYYLTVRRIRLLLEAATGFAGDSNEPSPLANRLAGIQRKLVLIPLIFVFLRMWETIYRLVEFSYGTSEVDVKRYHEFVFSPAGVWLRNAYALCNPAQGILNCFIFVVMSPKFDSGCGWCVKPLMRRWQTAGGDGGDGGVDKAYLLGYSQSAPRDGQVRIVRGAMSEPTAGVSAISSDASSVDASSSSSSSSSSSAAAWNESELEGQPRMARRERDSF
jgi:hypothetical protein